MDYIKNELRENIANSSKLWKTLKSIGLPKKGNNEAKVCLADNNEMFYEPKEVSRIFKNFYENLAQSLVDKLPAAPNKFNNDTTKTYYDNLGINGELKFSEVDPKKFAIF